MLFVYHSSRNQNAAGNSTLFACTKFSLIIKQHHEKNNLLTVAGSTKFYHCGNGTEKKLAPSGNIVTKNIAVQAFNAIEAAGIYELVLTQGDKEAVRIEADDNMQELLV